MNKTELEKLSKQELIKACMDIKRISEQKTEIIRGLENIIKEYKILYGDGSEPMPLGTIRAFENNVDGSHGDRCTCTEPRTFEGNGIVIICKSCGLPIIDRREEYKTNKPERLKFQSVEDENGFV